MTNRTRRPAPRSLPAPPARRRARRSADDLLEDLVGDLEVRVHRADVVVLLEGLDQAEELRGARLVEFDARRRALHDVGALDLDAPLLDRRAHRREVAGGADDLERVLVGDDVLGARLDGEKQIVLAVARGVDRDNAALLEQIRDAARLTEVAAVLAQQVAHVGAGAVAVVGVGLDQKRRAARSVTLIEDGLDRVGVRAGARALGDRALDVVLGHRGVLGLLHGVPERRVRLGVPPALARRHADRARELRELRAAAGVDDRLLVLDAGPFGVSRHATHSRRPPDRLPAGALG